MFAVTSVYAGLIALLYLYLSLRVIMARFDARVSYGDGGDKVLFKRIRVHSNFAEYAPLALVLLALTEAQGAPALAVHALGLLLLVGRLSHAIGFGRSPQIVPLRRLGVYCTFAMLALAGLGLLTHALF